MAPRPLMVTVLLLLLGAILPNAPTVHSCVNFSARYLSDGAGENPLGISLFDNLSKVCFYQGKRDPQDGLYHLDCVDAFFATFDITTGVVQYSNPGINVQFLAVYNDPSWTACEFDCQPSDCFA